MKPLLVAVRGLVQKYPARCISAASAVVVFVAARLGVVVPEQSVIHALEFASSLLLAGEATHHNVTPVTPVTPTRK